MSHTVTHILYTRTHAHTYTCTHTHTYAHVHRRGCKPFVEVFQEGARLFTSATQDTMDSIDSFTSDDRGVQIPVGVSVRGNVMVVLHHIRAIPIARKAGVVSHHIV